MQGDSDDETEDLIDENDGQLIDNTTRQLVLPHKLRHAQMQDGTYCILTEL